MLLFVAAIVITWTNGIKILTENIGVVTVVVGSISLMPVNMAWNAAAALEVTAIVAAKEEST